MSTKIALVHNLPGGGGLRMLSQIIERYKDTFEIDVIKIGTNREDILGVNNIFIQTKPWKGFLLYNFWLIFILPFIHTKVAKEVDWSKYKLILFTHDYFTKSPYLLKYANHKKKMYLCQESQREFYEPLSIHAQSIKDKLAYCLRLPIKWIDRNNVKYSSILFCNSKYSQKTLEKIYGRKFIVIYPGVDEKFFFPGKEKKAKIILCVGGINSVKNQEFIVNSLRPLLNTYKFVFVGDGKKESIKRLQKISKNISIIKSVTDQSLRILYRSSMLTCIAAFREPFGLSSIESQACGTPVLTVNDGGTKETVVDGRTGYISSMSEKEYLIKAKKIINKVSIMGKEARKEVLKNWTAKKTLEPLDRYFI